MKYINLIYNTNVLILTPIIMTSINSPKNTRAHNIPDRWSHKIWQLLSNIKNKLRCKCRIYMNLIALYTPIGKLLEFTRGPKSLKHWAPTKDIPHGLLSNSIPLPNPDKLSFKTKQLSRIITWSTKQLLQAAKLANRPPDSQLSECIHTLNKSLNANDYEHIFKSVDKLAEQLMSSSQSNDIKDMNETERRTFHDNIEQIQDLMQYTCSVWKADQQLQRIEQLTKPSYPPISRAPKDNIEFLTVALQQAIPAMTKDQQNPKDIEDAKRFWITSRAMEECSLHKACVKLELQSNISDEYEQKIDNIEQSVLTDKSSLKTLPGDAESFEINILLDVIYDRPINTYSPIISFMVGEYKHALSSKYVQQLDALEFLSTKRLILIKILHTDQNQKNLVLNYVNKRIKQLVIGVGQYIKSSMPGKTQDDINKIDAIVNDLSNNFQLSQKHLSV